MAAASTLLLAVAPLVAAYMLLLEVLLLSITPLILQQAISAKWWVWQAITNHSKTSPLTVSIYIVFLMDDFGSKQNPKDEPWDRRPIY